MHRALAFTLASLLVCTAWLVPSPAAADSPVAIAIWHPIQYVEDTESVTGFRFSLIYGRHARVAGLDVTPLAARTDGDQVGLMFGMSGEVGGDMSGWQAGGVMRTKGLMRGVQHGVVSNEAGSVRGLQIGLVNRTQNLYGFQIGLLNFNEGGRVKFSPVLNWQF